MQHIAYKFRIKPTLEQEIFFSKTFGCVRKIYNLMLESRKANYELSKNGKGSKTIKPTPAKYKEEYEYLKEVDSLALSNAQLNLERAFKNYFKDPKVGFPKFKSKKKSKDSYTTNNQNGTIVIVKGKYLKLPKLKTLVKMKMHRQVIGEIKSVTISRNSCNEYYVSILCRIEITPLKKTNSKVGIDLGIKELAYLSTGEIIENHRYLIKQQEKLKKEQKKLSRRYEKAKKEKRNLSECQNYQKQKMIVAKIHQKITNQRNDYLNKITTNIIKNHDIICIEDLSIKEMMNNHQLSQKIADVSWFSFISKLEYKAKWHERIIVKIDKWYPSTKICSTCGSNQSDKVKSLATREWICSKCQSKHHRDINATINILNEGLRLLSQK